MATTKGTLIEQIKKLLYGGDPSVAARVTRNQIRLLVEQEANAQLKAERFNINLPEGDQYPTATMIAEYDDVPVVVYKNVSRAILPATPIALPKGMGVWHVSKVNDIQNPFIPLQAGQFGLIKNTRVLGQLSGLIGYEPLQNAIVFNKNLVASGISAVYMQLLIIDLSALDDEDLLPITPDMERDIRNNVLNVLLHRPPADRTVDNNDKA